MTRPAAGAACPYLPHRSESCDKDDCQSACGIDVAALETLMPMHLVISKDGRILRAGPTLRKLRAAKDILQRPFFEVFDMRRPIGITDVGALLRHDNGRFSAVFRHGIRSGFKGLAVPMSCGRGILANLSFGISIVDAVETYDLSSGDFAATDLTVEMLYLVEAKSAASQESRKLNARLQAAKVAAEEQAFTDTLTGLKNRRAMYHVVRRLAADRIPFGLMQVDLDYFKQVNDTHGHAAGDEVLQAVARILVAETREVDTVARVGGDEFVVIFQDLTDTQRLEAIAARIVSRLEEPVPHNGAICRISGSVGITTSRLRPGAGIEILMEDADRALYASKHAGRGRWTMSEASGA